MRMAFLCLYELVRIGFLLGAFVALQPAWELPFPTLPAITPGGLFFIMALFLALDARRYIAFCPLYLAGKVLSVVISLIWIFFADIHTMAAFLDGTRRFFVAGFVIFLVAGDMLCALFVSRIIRK